MQQPRPPTDMQPMDGNAAATHVAYFMSDCDIIYPISPSSTMSEEADAMMVAGRKNLWSQVTTVKQMQSEAGVAAALHGALSAGACATTFTASQGLLLMIPNMYKVIAGELFPCVIHVAARALSTQALSIFGDHQDVMAARATGWSMLCSATVQEVMDMALVSHIATYELSVPFLHFFDGFRTSHEIQKIHVISEDTMRMIANHEAIQRHRQGKLSPEHPDMRGSNQNPDFYFQAVERANTFYTRVPDTVQTVFNRVAAVTGRPYHLFDYVGATDAEHVVVIMGSGAAVAEETVSYLVSKLNRRVGVVKVRLFRPFSVSHFLEAIPKSCSRICVLDRTKEVTAPGEPLFLDVSAAVLQSGRQISVIGGRYGLGSKDFTPGMVVACFDNLASSTPNPRFTVGITDDLTHTSLPVRAELDTVPQYVTQCLFWGIGSDGTVGANKNTVKIIAKHTDFHCQAYFYYDALKAGGVTVSHLRFGRNPINSSYCITHADFVACHTGLYVHRFDMVDQLKNGGVFLLNSSDTDETIGEHLPPRMKHDLAEKNAVLYVVDATKISEQLGIPGRINNIMQAAFFRIVNVLPPAQARQYMHEEIEHTYHSKGQQVVDTNKSSVDVVLFPADPASDPVHRIHYPRDEWAALPRHDMTGIMPELYRGVMDEFGRNVVVPAMRMQGDRVPVSQILPGGRLPVGVTQFQKRSFAINVPWWNKETCIQCNQCSFVCPHSVIRPFVLSPEEKSRAPGSFETIPLKGVPGHENDGFRIQISPRDCTGCSVCAMTCPVPGTLVMKPTEQELETQDVNWNWCSHHVQPKEMPDPLSVRGSQFRPSLLEFHGACAGCGEPQYIRVLTQLYGERLLIANAVGCTSVWSAPYPYSAYTVSQRGLGPAWHNNLFEDDAEFGFGIVVGTLQQRKRLHQMASYLLDTPQEQEHMDAPIRDALNKWLQVWDDYDGSKQTGDALRELCEKQGRVQNPTLREIMANADLLAKPCVWIIGGDGWAHDIGFGGLDHILRLQEKDIHVMVIDTEVYSNTGGQRSKSTQLGAVHKFAQAGKDTMKKDMGRYAMSLGNVYVASCSMGYNMNQVIKALKEANDYRGASLLLCYAPCIEHGVRGGMAQTMKQEKLAVETGYWITYRFNPTKAEHGENPFTLDCTEPKKDIEEFLKTNNRWLQLLERNPEHYREVVDLFREEAKRRFYMTRMVGWEYDKLLEAFPVQKGPAAAGGGATRTQAPARATGRNAVVLYATDTGNSLEAAQVLATELHRCCPDMGEVRLAEMGEADPAQLAREQPAFVLLVTSTVGKGELPRGGNEFLKKIEQTNDFQGLPFAVFGLGSSLYRESFNAGAKTLFEQLRSRHARPLTDMGMGDDEAREGWHAGLQQWVPQLCRALSELRTSGQAPPQQAGLAPAVSPRVPVEGATASKRPSATPKKVPVLYASETGNAQEAAGQVAEALKRTGVEAPLFEMNDFTMDMLRAESMVVLVSSVYGHGDVPRNGSDFLEMLRGTEPQSLGHLNYMVFGLGSMLYASTFCQAARLLDEQMARLGAHNMAPRGEGDDEAKGGWHAGLERWLPNIEQALSKRRSGGTPAAPTPQEPITQIRILYATTTGQAQRIAEQIREKLHTVPGMPRVEVTNVSEYNTAFMPQERALLVFVTSCADPDGVMPAEGQAVMNFLRDPKHPRDLLRDVRYSVLGLGDSRWGDRFVKSMRELVEGLDRLGARKAFPEVAADQSAARGPSVETAVDSLCSALSTHLGRASGLKVPPAQPSESAGVGIHG
ncbi:Pyruvate:ferredoxin oxidoreductase [Paratrimastix pyriformis]|uniref:Pyruvate:ferredoxin oxidoreductase n=1 Tax=Paratrimastix pyriformis TaxID=342808 RepID=A0ABQ8UEZ8_9EUKA|nr:Pyruvate:ferredoxin oxidoreductase [Paratrimastix pyriformis]